MYLTISDHAEAHRELWERNGRLEDKIAWLMLSGKTEEGEIVRRELCRELARKNLWTPEACARRSEAKKGKPNGCLGTTRSEASRNKMRDAQRKLWSNPEHRRRLSAAHTGKRHTAEHRQRIRESMMGQKHTLGKKMSAETRQRMAAAQQRRRAAERMSYGESADTRKNRHETV